MSLQSERLQLLMQRLGLNDMVHSYEALAEQAAQKDLPYCDFLEQVLDSEANVRQERNIKVRTQLAGFPDLKRLEQFDFQFPTSIDEKKIRELASLRFLERHENAVFLGPPGVGKTHLAVSLGLEAIRHGFSVYFVSLPDLLDRLVQAQAENRMRRKMVICASAACSSSTYVKLPVMWSGRSKAPPSLGFRSFPLHIISGLQRLQPIQDGAIFGPRRPRLSGHRPDLRNRLALHLQIDLRVTARRGWTGMAQHVTDGREIDAGL